MNMFMERKEGIREGSVGIRSKETMTILIVIYIITNTTTTKMNLNICVVWSYLF
jgi:hypothetical protein